MSAGESYFAEDELRTREVGALLAPDMKAGDTVLLEGPLGAGKTTLVRGLLKSLGYDGPVRSPTFNLLQVFPTDPPVLHADLYRLSNAQGIGLEDYLGTHLCLIEWPDRAPDLSRPESWRITIEFEDGGRRITVCRPQSAPSA